MAPTLSRNCPLSSWRRVNKCAQFPIYFDTVLVLVPASASALLIVAVPKLAGEQGVKCQWRHVGRRPGSYRNQRNRHSGDHRQLRTWHLHNSTSGGIICLRRLRVKGITGSMSNPVGSGSVDGSEQHFPAIAIAVAEPIARALLALDLGVAALDGPVGERLGPWPAHQQRGPPSAERLGLLVAFGVVPPRR